MSKAITGDEYPAASQLVRFFASGVLAELGRARSPFTATALFQQLGLHRLVDPDISVGDFYDFVFSRLVRDYRAEYVYKNALAEKRFWGRHNLNTAFMFTEFRAAGCKADVVVVNGTSHVYEIKTGLDDFSRLDKQLAAYSSIFDYITVVTEERLFDLAQASLPQSVGILTLADKKYRFRHRYFCRKPISNKSNVVPALLFDSLTRPEYLSILKSEVGMCLSGLPNTKIYSEAKKLFSGLPPDVAHDSMVRALRRRGDGFTFRSHMDKLPSSLKAAVLSLHMNKEQQKRFVSRLNSPVGVVLA